MDIASHNDLKSNTKKKVIDLLNARLADAIDLALLTKQAHWNVKGPTFIAVHEMLDTFRTDLDVHVDTIAERVAQLGGIALGTTQAVAEASPLRPYPTGITKIEDHLKELVERYAEMIPVTLVDGLQHDYWRVDPARLRAALTG